MEPAPSRPAARFVLPAVLLGVLMLSWAVREANQLRLHRPGVVVAEDPWFSADADGLYHARRVARALDEGGLPAAHDPLLDHPRGALVPWPPYDDALLAGVLGPFAPDDAEERAIWLEHRVAELPLVFGVCASALAALAGWLLAGALGAAVAGSCHALFYGAVHYSVPGVGDHHAWVSLLAGAMLLLVSAGLRGSALQRPRRAGVLGACAGACAGLLLGSWVAALLYVLEVQLVLALLLLAPPGPRDRAVARLGLGFHVAALLVVLPAVLQSPWKAEHPWMVVNLSWFHPLELALGALVFVPLLFMQEGSPWRRRHPWLVAAALAALGLASFLLQAGPAPGVAEGLDWVSRNDEFMSGIAESEPLLGADRTGTGGLFAWTGFGALLLPFAGLAAAWAAWRRGRLDLLPWLVACVLLAFQALAQRRFADALSLPMAALLGWGAAALWTSERGVLRDVSERLRRLPAAVPFVAALAAVALAQLPTLAVSWDALRHREEARVSASTVRLAGQRILIESLRDGSGSTAAGSGVLARWDLGHVIEWAAGLPTVATNFGTYLGEEGFRTPARFFLAADPDAAEGMLLRGRIRYVLVTSADLDALETHVRAAGLPAGHFLGMARGADGQVREQLRPAWFRTLGARLMLDGRILGAEGPVAPLRFLRMVRVSPVVDPAPALRGAGEMRCGWLWERVEGARVRGRGAPGEELRVVIEVRFRDGYRVLHEDASEAGADGIAELRVPYSTDGGVAEHEQVAAQWTMAGDGGALAIPEIAVLRGVEILVR